MPFGYSAIGQKACNEYHDRATVESAGALRHRAGWKPADGCRSAAQGYQALGDTAQGGGRGSGARRPAQPRGGLRALQAQRGRVPVLADGRSTSTGCRDCAPRASRTTATDPASGAAHDAPRQFRESYGRAAARSAGSRRVRPAGALAASAPSRRGGGLPATGLLRPPTAPRPASCARPASPASSGSRPRTSRRSPRTR